ncbi:flagellar filament capping protein FliD [Edaphobacter albus]|uniref:flagellar filament capping protein FliD n=1 Tax=Edaphobacter sp. 4G125 TaxID=2763071 RepID=UPI001646CA25|nr:flagellar filament capping protein FliD [Edaphobacter sp. 4G125]QNI38278.1 flagellar filament capping protein FliD [Edaphobacter sp. 4G125]
MGTVGINFGPINSGQGFDVTSTVNQILAAEQAIEKPWKTQLTNLQAQDTALSKFGTDLSTLATALQNLTDFNGVFASKQGSSSNPDVLALSSASNLAVAGSHTIVVNHLAQTSSQYSDKITDATSTLSGSLTLTIGGNNQTLNISGQTLSQLAASINAASMGVSASIVTDTTGSRLSLVSKTSGAAGEISLSASLTNDVTGTSIGFQQGMQGMDASLNVDGLNTTSASNTVTGLIPGVTFQLLSVSPNPNQPVQVQITNNNSVIEQTFNAFVTAYNAVVNDITTQEGKDSNGNPQPLYGDPTLAMIQNQLSQGLLSGSSSGAIKSLGQLGITVDQHGQMNLNVSTLDSALNQNFTDVMGFLQNSNSFGQTFTSMLGGLSSTSTKGAIYLALQQNSSQESMLNKNISDQEARIADDRTRLTNELNTANQILQSLPGQLNMVDQLYSAITGYKSGQ